ncbi:hypothetical protein HDV00_004681 [Rhizophlyctis rosea]|nr:hypothetical protein HDV00_004681 [Rhizophlyctis rosea]
MPPPLLVDIGANLTHRSLLPTEPHLTAAFEAGVQCIIITGTSVPDSRKAVKICHDFKGRGGMPKLFCTVGVHPHDAGRALTSHGGVDGVAKVLEKLIQENRDVVVAVGECGLDYDRNFSSHQDQEAIFNMHLRLAQKLDMPLFLHERDAYEAFVVHLDRFAAPSETNTDTSSPTKPLRGVVHCWTSGDTTHLQHYLSLGYHIGITGWVCDPKRGAALAAALPSIPRDKLMIETDAPFLIPRNAPKSSRRGGGQKVNEPVLLPYVAKRVAELYGVGVGEVAEWTNTNVKDLFGIELGEGNVMGDSEEVVGVDR